MDNVDLIREIEAQRNMMVAVATGGPRIDTVNQEYVKRRILIREELARRGIEDPNPYGDLWAWYGKWSSGDLPSYSSRRNYLSEIFQPLIDLLAPSSITGVRPTVELTGWTAVDRDLGEMRRLLETAQTAPQFQAVGLFCREILITVAQIVWDRERHPIEDGIEPSDTDAKRRLSAFFASELAGGPNEEARRHARASLDLANSLQHARTADFRKAALCAEATTAVVNLVAILSGRRDPDR
ncbi:hypothetical protein HS125_10360 [bacterium]|nr:hypothetical protein [bacterium]